MPRFIHLSPHSQHVPAASRSRIVKMEDPAAWLTRLGNGSGSPPIHERFAFPQHPSRSRNQPSRSDEYAPSTCCSLTSGPTIETISISNGTDDQPHSDLMETRLRPQSILDSLSYTQARLIEDLSATFNPEELSDMRWREEPLEVSVVPSPTGEHRQKSSLAWDDGPPRKRAESEDQARIPPWNHTIRSISVSSSDSTSSQHHGSNEGLETHVAAGSDTLEPKPANSPKEQEPGPLRGKKNIARSVYKRPKYPKVYCSQCDEYPDGFRGEHELRRHIEASHKAEVRRWVCVDPSTRGNETDYEPYLPVRWFPPLYRHFLFINSACVN